MKTIKYGTFEKRVLFIMIKVMIKVMMKVMIMIKVMIKVMIMIRGGSGPGAECVSKWAPQVAQVGEELIGSVEVGWVSVVACHEQLEVPNKPQ